jgi:hypothetical protein
MSTFKVGDKVRCIDEWVDDLHRLYLRRAYRIINIAPISGDRVQVKGHQTREITWWFARRFEKVLPNRKR